MQRVIDQLSETKDPKLFNKKINKLLDLFDKWEQNLVEREQHLLQNSKKLKNIQSTESSSNTKKYHHDKETTHLMQLQIQMQECERSIENREAILFSDKQDLEKQLNFIKKREITLQEEKDKLMQKENIITKKNVQEEHQINMKVQAIQSRLYEKGNILAEKKNNQVHRQEQIMNQKQHLDRQKEKVMKEWDEVISSAQQIKSIEQENKRMLLQLRDIHTNVDLQSSILDKKYESLHQMHCYQQYKQQIDEKEFKLRLKEENIRLLQKELLSLRSHISSNSSGIKNVPNQQPSFNQAQTASCIPRDDTQISQKIDPQNSQKEFVLDNQRQIQQNKTNLQISLNSQQSCGNISSERMKTTSKDCNIPKPMPLQSSSSSTSISSNSLHRKAASTSKIKQKFTIKNIRTDDSQIFSPISKHNPMLSSFSGISPLNKNREDDIIEGGAMHQTLKTINSGQNLCTVNETKSDQMSKAYGNFDSTNYEYQKMNEKRRLFADQLQDNSDLHIVEEKSYNQLSSLCTDSHQNSTYQTYKNSKIIQDGLFKYSRAIQKGKQYFADQKSSYFGNDEIIEHQQYESVKNDNDRLYLQNLLHKKTQRLRNYEEPNLSSNQEEEDSINLTHTLQASPSKIRISYNLQNDDKDY